MHALRCKAWTVFFKLKALNADVLGYNVATAKNTCGGSRARDSRPPFTRVRRGSSPRWPPFSFCFLFVLGEKRKTAHFSFFFFFFVMLPLGGFSHFPIFPPLLPNPPLPPAHDARCHIAPPNAFPCAFRATASPRDASAAGAVPALAASDPTRDTRSRQVGRTVVAAQAPSLSRLVVRKRGFGRRRVRRGGQQLAAVYLQVAR